MTSTTWAMDDISYLTWQNIMFIADKHAAEAIRQYAEANGIEGLEDTAPYDPALRPEQSLNAVPEIREIVTSAADNPANQPVFGIKQQDIVDSTVEAASFEARSIMTTSQWTALVKASALAILGNTPEKQLASEVDNMLEATPPAALNQREQSLLHNRTVPLQQAQNQERQQGAQSTQNRDQDHHRH